MDGFCVLTVAYVQIPMCSVYDLHGVAVHRDGGHAAHLLANSEPGGDEDVHSVCVARAHPDAPGAALHVAARPHLNRQRALALFCTCHLHLLPLPLLPHFTFSSSHAFHCVPLLCSLTAHATLLQLYSGCWLHHSKIFFYSHWWLSSVSPSSCLWPKSSLTLLLMLSTKVACSKVA